MSTVIGKVAAVFTASTNGLTSGVNTAKSSLSSLQGTVEKVHGKLSLLTAIEGAQLFGSLASSATSAARSMISMGNATAQMIDEQSKAAAKIGVSLQAFTALSQAAELAGISQGKVTGAVQKMSLALVAAEGGSEKAQKAFQSIGLAAEELSKMSPEQAFQAIAEQIAKLPTPAERTAAAIKIFGKAGKDLGPMFEGGAAAIKQATEEAYLFGTALDTTSGKQVEEMNDSFTRLGKVFEGFRVQLVAAFAPAVTLEIEKLISSLKDAGGMREVALQFAEIIGGAVIDLVDGAVEFAKNIKEALGQVKEAFTAIDAIIAAPAAVGRVIQGGAYGAASMVRTGATENFNDPTAMAWEKKAQEAFKAADANNTKFWDYLFGVQREVSDKIESDGRRVLRENIERMRAEAPQLPAEAPPPPDVMTRPENQRPVSEATGKTQVSLLQQIAKAVGVKDPQAVFTIAGAAGGN